MINFAKSSPPISKNGQFAESSPAISKNVQFAKSPPKTKHRFAPLKGRHDTAKKTEHAKRKNRQREKKIATIRVAMTPEKTKQTKAKANKSTKRNKQTN